MIPEFKRLDQSEIELMQKAPILACILIAGADQDIDDREIKGSIELANNKYKKFKGTPLANFYLDMSQDFEDKLKIIISSYPFDAFKRSAMITDELAQVNQILPKLDKAFANDFYKSLKDIAVKTAESSGGLLGMSKVGEEEARLVDLPMISDPSNY